MTQLVFALMVTMGAQTISVEHWSSIQTCLWYAEAEQAAPPHLPQDITNATRASTQSATPCGSTPRKSKSSTTRREMFAETLAGIALVKSAVDGIKSAISRPRHLRDCR